MQNNDSCIDYVSYVLTVDCVKCLKCWNWNVMKNNHFNFKITMCYYNISSYLDNDQNQKYPLPLSTLLGKWLPPALL